MLSEKLDRLIGQGHTPVRLRSLESNPASIRGARELEANPDESVDRKQCLPR